MKKRVFVRCLIGAPLGLALSTAITIVISLTVGDGRYYPVVPELAADCGTEMNAVLLQAACSLLYGAMWGGASMIWEQESWSILRQTITHLILCSAATFPAAFYLRWMPHNAAGVFTYFGIFFGIYLIIWVSQYAAMKKRVEQINAKVRQNNSKE